MEHNLSRRAIVLSTSRVLTAAWIGANWAGIATAAEHALRAAQDQTAERFEYLSVAEAADVEAITAQIVPSGSTPGAREAHAVYFIDRAFDTFFSALAPEVRSGLAGFQSKFRAAHPQAVSFAAATAQEQIAFLHSVDQTEFFECMRLLTLLGMFCDPRYGGNFGKAGWRLLGFEDRHVFTPPFGYYDRDYPGFVPSPTQSRS